MTQRRTGIYWLTGLSGAGKTTLSLGAAELLRSKGYGCLVLDGDILRADRCSDLGFGPEDRKENLRRAGELALLAAQQSLICLWAFITPYQAAREALRQRLGGLYHKIYISCPLETCLRRDPKQNYAKARQNAVNNYTGLGGPLRDPRRAAALRGHGQESH